jgi:putative transposase
VTAPRIIVPGATTALTRRTTLRKAFLAPWHPLVSQVWLYALADAQRATQVAVHHAISVINHHHLTVTPQVDNLPEFTQRFHHNVSRALNVLLEREHYDTPGQVFDGRSAHYMRLLDAPAQASQLVYEHNNCVAAGLVSRPEHMPDHAFDFALWRRGYIDVDRPPVYFSADRPRQIRLYVTPPPLLFAAFGGDLDWLIYHMRRTSEDAGRTLRAARNRPALGAQRVARLHPWSEPRTLREPGGSRIPTFRIGARGLVGTETAVSAALETREFRLEHRDARIGRRAGDQGTVFPYGTYEMREQHGVVVASVPKPGALVTQPGPLLCDIEAELAAELRPATRTKLREQTTEMLEEIRDAMRSESPDLCTQADLDFDRSNVATDLRDSGGGDIQSTIVRFDLQSRPAAHIARRVIVLRNLEPRHPPGAPTRHGADPPQ